MNNTKLNGIFVELTFLDGFLNFGQSIIVLFCFASDSWELFTPIVKYWRILWYGRNLVKLADVDDLDDNTLRVCEQFETYHLENCRLAIAKDTNVL
jgi:hypothetical protein